jgi:hypothetical protein
MSKSGKKFPKAILQQEKYSRNTKLKERGAVELTVLKRYQNRPNWMEIFVYDTKIVQSFLFV